MANSPPSDPSQPASPQPASPQPASPQPDPLQPGASQMDSHSFEADLPSDGPQFNSANQASGVRSPRRAQGGRFIGKAAGTGGHQAAGQTAEQRNGASANGQRRSYNESFTVDYNPDPDLQADNLDPEPSMTRIAERTVDMANGAEDSNNMQLQERYQRQPAINPIKVAQAPVSVIAIAAAIVVIIGFTLGSVWLTLA
ncbi:MAG: hypothetical protein AAFP03_16435, partial [Cyanobacteria bacterium J06598_3]